MYKMVDISAKTWNKTGVSIMRIHENDNVNKAVRSFLCISDVGKRWGSKNIYDLTDKEIKGKYGVKNMNELTKQQIRKFKIDRLRFKSIYRLSDPKTIKFRPDLGLNKINLILKKEQSVVIPLLKAFSVEKIELQHRSLENERVRTNMYFSEHKLVVEIDEKRHTDRNQNKNSKRQIR